MSQEIEREIKANLSTILENAKAAEHGGRPIRIVGASKKQPIDRINAYLKCCKELGLVAILGENYVQEFEKKRIQLTGAFESHFIGSLQRNKADDAVRIFDLIESVQSEEIASVLNKSAEKRGKRQKVLLQVNVSADPGKSGFSLNEVIPFLNEHLSSLRNLQFRGLMTITQFYDNPEDARPDFQKMRGLRDEIATALKLQEGDLELSMGMSADYKIAIEEGATIVRIGTALFGERS